MNKKLIEKNKKIEVIVQTNVTEIKGSGMVSSVVLDKAYKGKKALEVAGVFGAIGHIPLSALAVTLGVTLNDKKEIKINRDSETNVEGVFAAGDVVDSHFKQSITGVGEGVTAAHSAFEYITKNELVCTDDPEYK